MDETRIGRRDHRGHFRPNAPLTVSPFFRKPFRLAAVLKWLPGYFLPWNVVFALSAVLWWVVFIPQKATMQTLAPGWILQVLVINTIAVVLFYGFFEWRLYLRRSQETRFKYNPAFPADRPSRTFLFGRQDLDNIARTLISGVPIWTGWQVFVLWLWANDLGLWVGLMDSPVYLAFLALIVPILHQFHFYMIHRLIHTPILYKWVHSIHHKAVNPSPWSSLAMHPVEHLLYFSTVLFHLILPSHPLLAIYQLHKAGFGAIPGHVGFEKMEIGQEHLMDMHAYNHYLHHKYFEVNYGDGLVPFDKLFGTFHDGTEAADEAMRARLKRMRAQRQQAG